MSRIDNPIKSIKEGEKRFFVHIRQRGEGCDYTIACAQLLVPLPKTIETINQAEVYVMNGDNEGQLGYYGSEDGYDSVTILEAVVYPVDFIGYEQARRAEREAIDAKRRAAEKDELDRAEYARLRAKFGDKI